MRKLATVAMVALVKWCEVEDVVDAVPSKTASDKVEQNDQLLKTCVYCLPYFITCNHVTLKLKVFKKRACACVKSTNYASMPLQKGAKTAKQ